MEWQTYIVWGIGIVVAALIVRRVVCFIRGVKKGDCASCGKTGCPLHNLKNKRP